MAPTSTASRPTPTVRLRKVDQFPALRSVETNEQTRTLAWKQVRPRSSVNNNEIEPESTDDGGYDFAWQTGRRNGGFARHDHFDAGKLSRYGAWHQASRAEQYAETPRLVLHEGAVRSRVQAEHGGRGRGPACAVGSCRPSALRSRPIHHRTGAGRMNDVYIIESWFGERLNVRTVYAADADDAFQTHVLHYPGEHILSMHRGDELSVR